VTGALSRNGLRYAIEGEGPPVLLLLGIGGSLEIAAPIARGLRDAHRVVAFEYPGIGGSSASVPASIEGYAALVDELAAELQLEAAHLVAISFGVAVAVCLASAAPVRVRSLALVSGAALADSRFRRVSRVLADAARALEPPAFARLATALLFPPSFDEGRAALVDAIERAIAPAPRELVAIATQAEIGAALDLSALLPRIPQPAKIWVGDQDAFVTLSSARALHQAIPRSQLEIVEGAGHSLFAERPREMFASVRTFLTQAAPGAGS
jgi:pimeloyl-ACP methyl ester carboxylesterase